METLKESPVGKSGERGTEPADIKDLIASMQGVRENRAKLSGEGQVEQSRAVEEARSRVDDKYVGVHSLNRDFSDMPAETAAPVYQAAELTVDKKPKKGMFRSLWGGVQKFTKVASSYLFSDEYANKWPTEAWRDYDNNPVKNELPWEAIARNQKGKKAELVQKQTALETEILKMRSDYAKIEASEDPAGTPDSQKKFMRLFRLEHEIADKEKELEVIKAQI